MIFLKSWIYAYLKQNAENHKDESKKAAFGLDCNVFQKMCLS